MSDNNWDTAHECLRRAREARRLTDQATTAAERADLLEVERRWLWLAQSYSRQAAQPPNDTPRGSLGCPATLARVGLAPIRPLRAPPR